MYMSISLDHLRERWNLVMASMRIPPEKPVARSDAGIQAHDAILHQEFEAFFWRYESIISRYLWQMIGDQMAATDLCQETFFRAWRHFARIKDHPQVRSWLYRVATNLAMTHRQRQAMHPQSTLDDIFPGASDPGRRIADQDLVTRALQILPPKHRSVLLLFDVYGHSGNEIAEMLGMSINAVKMALHRAREQFRREYLREEGME
jgi:RNA polymerase sigma-70 factor, ECF subfamily